MNSLQKLIHTFPSTQGMQLEEGIRYQFDTWRLTWRYMPIRCYTFYTIAASVVTLLFSYATSCFRLINLRSFNQQPLST
jgi:hypothetical protein